MLLLAIFISTIAVFPVDASNPPKKNIHTTIILYPTPHINRTPIQTIEVAVDTESSMVDVAFNEALGDIAIYILNPMGQAIAKYECDTNTESQAYIPCNMDCDEVYSIKILGKDLEVSGYFDLQD